MEGWVNNKYIVKYKKTLISIISFTQIMKRIQLDVKTNISHRVLIFLVNVTFFNLAFRLSSIATTLKDKHNPL